MKLKINEKMIKIKELNIEVTLPEEYTGQYNKIEIPKGFRLIKLRELLFIWETEKYRKVLFEGYLKNPDYYIFYCEQLWNDKQNERSRWLVLDWDLVLGSCWDHLGDSSSYGRVVFVREKK